MQNVVILIVLAVIAVPVGLLVAIVRHRSRLEELEHRNQDLQADVFVLRRRVEALETRRAAEVPSSVQTLSAEPPEEAAQTWASPESPPAEPESDPEEFEVDEAMAAAAMIMPPPLPPLVLPVLARSVPQEEAMVREPSTTAPAFNPTVPVTPALPEFNWEQFMGVKLFAWIGGLALFLGLAFFVKYSFERNLIPPELRVAIGFLTGIGLVVGGVIMRSKDYKVTSHTLCATGIVSLYGVTYACRSIYEFPFFGPIPTLLLMVMITATAFTLAVRLDAMVVAVLGLVGGFLTPLLLSTGQDNPLGLFTFIALLDIGLLAVVIRTRWNNLVGLATAGTLVMQVGWLAKFFSAGRYFEGNAVLVAMAVFGGFALLFAAASWWTARREQGSPWLTGSALALIGMAALVNLYFISYSSLAGRPGMIFTYLLLVDALAIAMVWKQSELRQVLPVCGAIALGILGIWILGLKDTELLNWALGFVFVFALAHTLLPIGLARLKPELAAGNGTYAFPPMELCHLTALWVRWPQWTPPAS